MPNGKVKQEWQKQAVGSFLQGIFQSRQEKQERDRIMAEKEQLYQQGQHDANYKAKINNLWKMTEHKDPKIVDWAFKQLEQMNAVGSVPEQTPMNELALAGYGLTPGAATEWMRSGRTQPETERIVIPANSAVGQMYPEMVGKEVSAQEYERMARSVQLIRARERDIDIKGTKGKETDRLKELEQRRKTLREEKDGLQRRLNALPKDRLGNPNQSDPAYRSIMGRMQQIENDLRGIDIDLQGETTRVEMQKRADRLIQIFEEYKKTRETK